MATRIGMEDSREREAQLGETTLTADGTETCDGNGIAVAIQARCSSSAHANERDGSVGEGIPYAWGHGSTEHRGTAVRISKDIVKLPAEREPHIVAFVELRNPGNPRCWPLCFGRPDVLRVAHLGARGEETQNGTAAASQRRGATGSPRHGSVREGGEGNDFIHPRVVAADDELRRRNRLPGRQNAPVARRLDPPSQPLVERWRTRVGSSSRHCEIERQCGTGARAPR